MNPHIESLVQPELIEQWCRGKGMLCGPDAMATVMDVLVKPVISFELFAWHQRLADFCAKAYAIKMIEESVG